MSRYRLQIDFEWDSTPVLLFQEKTFFNPFFIYSNLQLIEL